MLKHSLVPNASLIMLLIHSQKMMGSIIKDRKVLLCFHSNFYRSSVTYIWHELGRQILSKREWVVIFKKNKVTVTNRCYLTKKYFCIKSSAWGTSLSASHLSSLHSSLTVQDLHFWYLSLSLIFLIWFNISTRLKTDCLYIKLFRPTLHSITKIENTSQKLVLTYFKKI